MSSINTSSHGGAPAAAAAPNNNHQQENQQIVLTMEDMLGVPAEVLYRQMDFNKNNNKALMTRSEAEVFLKIRMLAQEMDVITELTEQITQRQDLARRMEKMIVASGNKNNPANPWLTPLLPILQELTQMVAVENDSEENPAGEAAEMNDLQEDSKPPATTSSHSLALFELHASMTQLVGSLQESCGMLWQHAEQNWALADSLWDIVDESNNNNPTRLLAQEKQSLAELQEHVAQRIEVVLMMQYEQGEDREAAMEASQSQRRLFAEGSSSQQQQQRAAARMSQDSEGGGEVDRPLTLEEVYTPLATVCQRLFAGQGIVLAKKQAASSTSAAANNKATNKSNSNSQDNRKSRQSQERSASTVASPDYDAASQRTTNAANMMVSLFNIKTKSPTDRTLRRKRMGLDDDSSTDSEVPKQKGLDFTQESSGSPAKTESQTKRLAATRKRSRPLSEEENDGMMENSQVVRASAANALVGMVHGKM